MSARGEAVTLRAERRHGFFARLRGLIGRPAPAAGEAVWLRPCRQVHTFGMAYPIDVVHLDREGRVLQVERLRPWRIGGLIADGDGVLELCAGEAERLGLRRGVAVNLIAFEGPC